MSGTNASQLLAVMLMLLSAACLPDPQRAQSADLLDQLGRARGLFAEQPPRVDEACTIVGTVQTRLYGEPGLVDVQPTWSHLRDATTALQVACGEGTLLAEPSTGSSALEAARLRWSQGIQRQASVACENLRAAATLLNRAAPC